MRGGREGGVNIAEKKCSFFSWTRFGQILLYEIPFFDFSDKEFHMWNRERRGRERKILLCLLFVESSFKTFKFKIKSLNVNAILSLILFLSSSLSLIFLSFSYPFVGNWKKILTVNSVLSFNSFIFLSSSTLLSSLKQTLRFKRKREIEKILNDSPSW